MSRCRDLNGQAASQYDTAKVSSIARYEFNASRVAVTCPNAKDRTTIIALDGQAVRSNVRSTSLIFAWKSEKVVILILLPSTSKQLLELSLVRPLKSTYLKTFVAASSSISKNANEKRQQLSRGQS